MSYLYHTFIYEPMYNGLIFLMDVLPWVDAGVAIVIFTVIVKVILFPLSKKAVTTQLRMKKLEPELAALKEKYKEDKAQYGIKTMELYRANKINPFASIILIFIQLPIILALYKVFRVGFNNIDTNILYHFVSVPQNISTHFLGLIDISQRSLILAILAGISSFIQIRYSVPKVAKKPVKENMTKEEKFRHELSHSMNVQMRFMMPALAFLISWTISGAIAVYWITSNLFTLAQELVIRKSVAKANDNMPAANPAVAMVNPEGNPSAK